MRTPGTPSSPVMSRLIRRISYSWMARQAAMSFSRRLAVARAVPYSTPRLAR